MKQLEGFFEATRVAYVCVLLTALTLGTTVLEVYAHTGTSCFWLINISAILLASSIIWGAALISVLVADGLSEWGKGRKLRKDNAGGAEGKLGGGKSG